MSLLADVPAWYWQVLGAVCGLGLGLWLGARRKGGAAPGVGHAEPKPAGLSALPSVSVPGSAALHRTDPRPEPRSDARASRPPEAAALTSKPAQAVAATRPVQEALKPAAAAVPASVATPPTAAALATTAAAPAVVEASAKAMDALREANLELAAKLRAATDLHARELLERSQEQQADHLRHEKQLEELRQAHAGELSHLMTAMVEQVDALQREHAQQLQGLEQELDRLRRAAQTSASASADALTRPVTMTMGGDMRTPH